jgi:hypothetical protein
VRIESGEALSTSELRSTLRLFQAYRDEWSRLVVTPNSKLTDDEERANDVRIGGHGCPRSSSFGRAPSWAVLIAYEHLLWKHFDANAPERRFEGAAGVDL